MKTTFIAAVAVLTVFAAAAQTGAYNIAKQQARRASEMNNAEQERIAHAAKDPAPPPAPAPVDPALEATLKNIKELQATLTAIGKGDGTDAVQKTALLNQLTAAAVSGKKPAAETVKKLADHLNKTVAGKKTIEAQKLARALRALFNASHLTETQQKALLEDVRKIFAAADAPVPESAAVMMDLQAVVEATQ
jgi:hypothetical protein